MNGHSKIFIPGPRWEERECFGVQNLKVFVEECHSLKEKFLRYALIMFFLESSTWKCRCKFLEAENFPKLSVYLYVSLAL
jgi:hypothetical protein